MKCAWLCRVAVSALLLSSLCTAQTPAADLATDATQNPPTTLTVPAGARIALALTHPLRSRSLHRGDDVYALITSPVTSNGNVAIPVGTYIQGKLDKLRQRSGRGELRLQQMTMTFANGYVVSVPGSVTLMSADGYLLRDPGNGPAVSAFLLPAVGAGAGAAIGHAASSPETIVLPNSCASPLGCVTASSEGSRGRSTAVGALVGAGAGMAGSLLILARSRGFLLDTGTPTEMTLGEPLSLDRVRVADAVNRSKTYVVQPIGGLQRPGRCGPGESWCDGSCVDVQHNDRHCGTCSKWCSADETCRSGSCTRTFP